MCHLYILICFHRVQIGIPTDLRTRPHRVPVRSHCQVATNSLLVPIGQAIPIGIIRSLKISGGVGDIHHPMMTSKISRMVPSAVAMRLPLLSQYPKLYSPSTSGATKVRIVPVSTLSCVATIPVGSESKHRLPPAIQFGAGKPARESIPSKKESISSLWMVYETQEFPASRVLSS